FRVFLQLAIYTYPHTPIGCSLIELNVVSSRFKAIMDDKSRPFFGYTRGETKPIPRPLQTEKRLHDESVHPACCAVIPGPAASSGMLGSSVYIGSQHIGFNFIYF